MDILRSIRVLDFGRYIAGPYCAELLLDFGAEVIRIEKVGGSEDRFIAPLTERGDGALFLQCNAGKKGLTLNPMKPEGREIVRKLVATADVVVANLPDPALFAMGIDHDSLRAVREDIVLTTVDAFGARGPWKERPGFDGMGQAMSGAMYLSGPPDVPCRTVINYVDFSTALSAALGTVAALWERQATGRGRHVRASLLGSALALSSSIVMEEAALAPGRVATHNRSQHTGPSDVLPTRDGWICVQVVGDPLFRRVAELLEAPELLSDPRFASDADRGRHGEELSRMLGAWCASRTTDEALAALSRAGVPAGPVLSPREVLAHPQVREAALLEPVAVPGLAAPVPIAASPFAFGSERAPRRPAPALGEHTATLLAELGYPEEEVARLREARVV